MNLLAGTYYDPGTAVTEATTALLAMTALDTTNLRLTFTAPATGRVKVIIAGGCIHGATTFPQILVGCLENSPASGTVRGRQAPNGGGFNGTALATTQLPVRVEYIQTGLTPGQQYVWDAAYSVEILLAATGWKYGGPNNTTTNDAFGGISFEIWDPSPVYTAASGIPPTTPISARIDTIDDFVDTEIGALTTAVAAVQADTDNIQTRLPAALVSGRMDASVGAMAADVLTAAATAADFGTEVGTAVWATTTRILTAGTNIALAKGTGVTGFNDLSAAQVNAEVDTAIADAALATAANLATVAGYLDTEIAAILVDTNELQADWADGGRLDAILDAKASQASVDDLPTNAELSTALGTADDAILAQVALVKAKTDSLTFTSVGLVDANIQAVNDIAVAGSGTVGDPWGPM